MEQKRKNGNNCMVFERTLCLNPHEILSENIRGDLMDSRDFIQQIEAEP